MQPEPNPQNDEKDELAEGLRDSYSDLVTRTGRFIASTLIILFVLTVVVEQQIREYASKLKKQLEIHAVATKAVQGASQNLDKSFQALPPFVRSRKEREKAELFVGPLPRLSLRMDEGKLARVVQRLDEYSAEIKKLIIERKKEEEGRKKEEEEERKKKEAEEEAAAKEKGGEGGAAADVALGEKEPVAPPAPPPDRGVVSTFGRKRHYYVIDAQDERPSVDDMDRALEDLDKYKEAILARAAVVKKQEAAEKERKELAAGKKFIPTPFGNFEVIPRLALLAVAFAILLTYLTANAALARARTFARRYRAAVGPGATASDCVPAPPWLYNSERDMDRVLWWSRPPWQRRALAALFHFGWLAFGWWVSAECLFHWRSTETLMFRHAFLLDYALVVLLIVSTAAAASNFVRLGLGESLAAPPSLAPTRGRRAFLRGWALCLLATPAGGAGYLFRPASAAARAKRLPDPPVDEKGGALVLNKGTKVMHDPARCARHLPAEKNAERISMAAAPDGARLHVPIAARFWDELAKDYEAKARAMRRAAVHREHDAEGLDTGDSQVEDLGTGEVQNPAGTSGKGGIAEPALRAMPSADVTPDYPVDPSDEYARMTPEQLRIGGHENHEKAIECLKKAIALSPQSLHLYDRLVKVYGRLHRFGEVESLLKNASRMIEDEVTMLRAVGITEYGGAKAWKRLRRAQVGFGERLKSLEKRKIRWAENETYRLRLERLLEERRRRSRAGNG